MQNNLVSIAVATYNGEKYLKEQLDSIYNQTYKNIEVIVCDDCSSDKTVEILEEYSKNFGLKYFVNETNLGFVKNFEKAISLCSGDYIALSDQDDIWIENKIEILLKNIADNLLIHSDCELIDENGETIKEFWKGEIKSHKCFEDFLFSNVVTGCTILFKKDLLRYALPFPERLAYHDWYLAVVAAKFSQITYISAALTKYRQHIAQDTGTKKPSKLQSLLIDKINRFRGKKIHRVIAYEKHLKNLNSIADVHVFKNEQQSIIDAKNYFENYLSSPIHLKTFLIGLKYSKNKYSKKNYLYVRNILDDIVG